MRATAATIVLLFLALGGCADSHQPGEVPSGVADPQQFCTDRAFWECRRDEFAGRIGSDEAAVCYGAVEPMCEGVSWPAGCAPSEDDAAACIALLQQADLADLTNEELLARYPDCNLCP